MIVCLWSHIFHPRPEISVLLVLALLRTGLDLRKRDRVDAVGCGYVSDMVKMQHRTSHCCIYRDKFAYRMDFPHLGLTGGR